MTVKEYHPFGVVEYPEFRNFINMSFFLTNLFLLGKQFPIVSFHNYTKQTTVQNVKMQLNNVTSVCLTTDGWIA